MRTGKGREQSILREQLERAHMQLAITAHRIVQAAFRFRERRRIENDQIVLRFRFFCRAQKAKHILLDPVCLSDRCVPRCPRRRQALRALFHTGHFRRAGSCTR